RLPPGDGHAARTGDAGQVVRVPVGGLLDAPVRPGEGQRRARRDLHLDRLQLERTEDADAGHARRRARRAGRPGAARVGGAGRRLGQAHGRGPRPAGDHRHGQPRPLRRGGPEGLRRRRLAGAAVSEDPIPDTPLLDRERLLRGYRMNKMAMGLGDPANRAAFLADEAAYLDRFGLTDEEKTAVLNRDWREMIRLGGNLFFILKISAVDPV